jgi:hypothetical protein
VLDPILDEVELPVAELPGQLAFQIAGTLHDGFGVDPRDLVTGVPPDTPVQVSQNEGRLLKIPQ